MLIQIYSVQVIIPLLIFKVLPRPRGHTGNGLQGERRHLERRLHHGGDDQVIKEQSIKLIDLKYKITGIEELLISRLLAIEKTDLETYELT